MRHLILAATMVAGLASSSSAQTVVQRRSVDTTRVTVSYQFAEPNVPGDAAAQNELSVTMRKSFYELANAECDILSSIFKMYCRLAALNVQAGTRIGREGMNMQGSASYELTVRAAPSP